MKCDENLRVQVQKNRNIGSGSQKMEISGPGPGPDSEKISGLISGPGTRNKPRQCIYYIRPHNINIVSMLGSTPKANI